MIDQPEKLSTVSDMADRLQMHADKAYDLVRAGMPTIKFNSRIFRFHWPTVLAWLIQRN